MRVQRNNLDIFYFGNLGGFLCFLFLFVCYGAPEIEALWGALT